MNDQPSIEPSHEGPEAAVRLTAKQVLRFVIVVLLMPAVLFISAGRLNWVMGWVYSGVTIVLVMVSRIAMFRAAPELLRERARFDEVEDAKSWDRPIVLLVAVYLPLVGLIVAGLDMRFGWSPGLPLWLQIVALILVVLGTLAGTWAMAVNRFFSAVVRIQKDRGHTVVTGGPYRFVRHPAYTGGLVVAFASAVALESLWALIPAGLTALLYILRTALEDKTLQEELPGYKEYAERVRYRLVPGVW
jgi:protein-S-isoprenylcysteine O-methyltransferase Ste14